MFGCCDAREELIAGLEAQKQIDADYIRRQRVIIENLTTALMFYAAATRYHVNADGRGLGRRTADKISVMELDEGAVARKALEGLDTESIKSFTRGADKID